MLVVGIDQFTLVLRSNLDGGFDDWINWEAQLIIDEFMQKSEMLSLMDGVFDIADCKLPDGYTMGFSFHNSIWYFCVAINEGFRKLGVIVKFSGYCWSEYKKRYAMVHDSPMELHRFLRMTRSPNYSQRLSRVDPYVDLFNEGISVAMLKRSIELGRTEVRYGRYRK